MKLGAQKDVELAGEGLLGSTPSSSHHTRYSSTDRSNSRRSLHVSVASNVASGYGPLFTIHPCRTSAESSNSTDATYPLYSMIAFSPRLHHTGKPSGRIIRGFIPIGDRPSGPAVRLAQGEIRRRTSIRGAGLTQSRGSRDHRPSLRNMQVSGRTVTPTALQPAITRSRAVSGRTRTSRCSISRYGQRPRAGG